jgi:large subunit ribosomal protein L15
MPIQRRLPKRGFRSAMKVLTAGVRLQELGKLEEAVIDLAALKKANIVPAQAEQAKVYLSGTLEKAVTLRGIRLTKGAREAVTKAGGKIED